MRLLLTGFRPFAGLRRNVSGEVVCELAQRLRCGGAGAGRWERVEALVLPVVYAQAAPLLAAAVARLRPQVLVATGVHRRETFRLEALARNRDAARLADEAGEVRGSSTDDHGSRPICPDSPLTLPASLPLAEIARRLTQLGLPCEESSDAGGFLCNHVFFHACKLARQLRHDATTPSTTLLRCVGFIHLPPLAAISQAAPGEATPQPVSEAQLLAGLHACVEAAYQQAAAAVASPARETSADNG